jgi:hypothetical protein
MACSRGKSGGGNGITWQRELGGKARKGIDPWGLGNGGDVHIHFNSM